MSENVDLVRSIFAAWERADFSSAEWADPEIEFVMADGPEAGSIKGLAGLAAQWGEFLRAWDGYNVQADEYRELGGGRVLVLLHAVGGRGKSSGLSIVQSGEMGANLFDIRDGKVTRLVLYFETDHAFADLGLER